MELTPSPRSRGPYTVSTGGTPGTYSVTFDVAKFEFSNTAVPVVVGSSASRGDIIVVTNAVVNESNSIADSITVSVQTHATSGGLSRADFSLLLTIADPSPIVIASS